MSNPLRIALVAEGPTDGVVIEAALRAILQPRAFVMNQIFPAGSLVFGPLGAGWGGVYRWCHQSAQRGNGRLEHDAIVFQNYDLLILHLDADVAGYNYQDDGIVPRATDCALPCAQNCPPPSDTTNALRGVLLSWCGEVAVPPKTVICMPSKSTEAWVVASLFPNDQYVAAGFECYGKPENRLGQQPKKVRIGKNRRHYLNASGTLTAAWPKLASPKGFTEARRFQTEFTARVP